MEADSLYNRTDTKTSQTFMARPSDSFHRSPLGRIETNHSPTTFRKIDKISEVSRMTAQGKYTASFGQILESTYKLLEEIKSQPKQSMIAGNIHTYKSSDLKLSTNSLFSQTFRSPLKVSTYSDYRNEELLGSHGKRSTYHGPKRNPKLIVEESYKLINEIKATLTSARTNFEKTEDQVNSLIYTDPLKSPDSQANFGTLGTNVTNVYTEGNDERMNSRLFNSIKDKFSHRVMIGGNKHNGVGASHDFGGANKHSMSIGGKTAHSYNISINNENLATGGNAGSRQHFESHSRAQKSNATSQGGKFIKQDSPEGDDFQGMLPHDENLETESQNRSTVKNQDGNYDLQLEQAADAMGKVNAKNKRNQKTSKERPSHSKDSEYNSSHASFQESSNRPSSKNYNTKHAVISFGDDAQRGHGSQQHLYSSEFDAEVAEERSMGEALSPSQDIGAALGFSVNKKNTKKTLLQKKAPGGLKNITNAIAVDLDDDLKPNSALVNPQPQPKLQTDKISLTLTTYKPKPRETGRDTTKSNLQKSSDGFKNTSRSIESLPLERSIEGMGSSLYGSNYHISSEHTNLRSSKVLKKETSVGKNKELLSPKPSNTKNQRYFQSGKNASGGKMKK